MRQNYKEGIESHCYVGTSSHRFGKRPCGVKQSAKSMTLRQSGKSSMMSWPDVKLLPQTHLAIGLNEREAEKTNNSKKVQRKDHRI